MKIIKPLILLVCMLSYFSLTARADYHDNNGRGHAYGHDKNKHAQNEGPKAPVDGGISLLVAAGAALGVKRVFQNNKKNTSPI